MFRKTLLYSPTQLSFQPSVIPPGNEWQREVHALFQQNNWTIELHEDFQGWQKAKSNSEATSHIIFISSTSGYPTMFLIIKIFPWTWPKQKKSPADLRHEAFVRFYPLSSIIKSERYRHGYRPSHRNSGIDLLDQRSLHELFFSKNPSGLFCPNVFCHTRGWVKGEIRFVKMMKI